MRIRPELWEEARKRASRFSLSIGRFVESAILHELARTGFVRADLDAEARPRTDYNVKQLSKGVIIGGDSMSKAADKKIDNEPLDDEDEDNDFIDEVSKMDPDFHDTSSVSARGNCAHFDKENDACRHPKIGRPVFTSCRGRDELCERMQ